MNQGEDNAALFHAPGLRLAIAVFCLTSSACFGYAHIERRSAPSIEARIDRSDSENLYVTSYEGKEQTIGRGDVVRISHPGKVRLSTGMIIVAAGAALLIYGLVHDPCPNLQPGAECEEAFVKLFWIQGGIGMLLGGGALAITGGFTYYNSVTAMEPSPVWNTEAMHNAMPRLSCSFCQR